MNAGIHMEDESDDMANRLCLYIRSVSSNIDKTITMWLEIAGHANSMQSFMWIYECHSSFTLAIWPSWLLLS